MYTTQRSELKQRIFHRIGIVAAVMCAIPALWSLISRSHLLSTPVDVDSAWIYSGFWSAMAGAVYSVVRVFGWIIATLVDHDG